MNCARYINIHIYKNTSVEWASFCWVLFRFSGWLLKQKRVTKFIAILFVIYLSYKYAYEMNEC